MSKIGRKPIDITGITVQISGNKLTFKGPKGSAEYVLPDMLIVEQKGNALCVELNKEKIKSKKDEQEAYRLWGLNRVLLANKIAGSVKEFQVPLRIVGLGYKAASAGNKLVLSLGYSHKIDFPLPSGVSVDIDKTGQLLTIKSSDKFLAGQVASKIRDLRKPEPYKGSGIRRETEVVRRKAGKTKS